MASYYTNSKNQYGVRFYIIENGKRVHKNLSPFATKKQAEEAYVKYLLSLNEKKKLPYEHIKLKSVASRYFLNNDNKESSNVDAIASYNNFIAPLFGERYIKEITKKDIVIWQKILSKMGYSYPYRKKLRSRFNQILDYANELYDYPNPIQRVRPLKKPKEPKKEIEVLTFKEYTAFIKNVDELVYKLYFETLYYTGLRPSEALALTWQDIDFLNKTLKVNKTLTRKISQEDRANGISFKVTPPKSFASNRKISLSNTLINDLKAYYKKHTKNTYIFEKTKGKPLAEVSIQRAINEAKLKANITKRITPHVFRHTHASTLIEKGLPITVVAERLGHDDITTTLTTYAHVLNKVDTRAAEIFDNL